MRRREFITLLGGTAAERPLAAVCHICPVPDQARASDRRETLLIAE
jgi:hypothetical protein